MNEQLRINPQTIAAIEELPDSAPLLGTDPEALRARWEADGVLYFHNVIDKDATAAMRREYLDRLKEVGVVAPDATQPIWTGLDRLDGKLATQIEGSVWRKFVAHPSVDRVVRLALGEAPNWVPIVVHRASVPIDPAKAPADIFHTRHQDGPFNYGIDYITCWVPLMDIDRQAGGLAVVPGSHKASLYGGRPATAASIGPGLIADKAWRRPAYKDGDLLMFHSMTAHASLPNVSDRFRISADIRFMPSSVPAPIVGTITEVDGMIFRVATESGEERQLVIDDETIVRGPKAVPAVGDEMKEVVFVGASILAAVDDDGRTKLVRSSSRRFIDLPPTWFTELPKGWVAK